METDMDVILSGLLAGSMAMGALGLERALAGTSPSFEVEMKQRMIRSLRRSMPLLMLGTVLLTGLNTFRMRLTAYYLTLISFVLTLIVIAITLTVNAPLNRVFSQWRPDAVP
jgi:hypothetical protein